MNSTICFFVGSVTFVLMLLLKIPVKKLTWQIAGDYFSDSKKRYRIFKRLNMSIIVLTMLVAFICYCLVLLCIKEAHFKLCCTLKAGAVAIAFYAIYEQWFGEDGIEGNERKVQRYE